MRCWSELIIDSCTTLIRVDRNSELISKTRNRPRIRIRLVCFWSPHLWFTIDQGNMNGWFWVPACIPVRRAGAKCKSSNISHQSRREKIKANQWMGFATQILHLEGKVDPKAHLWEMMLLVLSNSHFLLLWPVNWSYYWVVGHIIG